MHVVDTTQTGRVAEVVQQMPKVMQQRCRDQRVVRVFGFGQSGRLQGVFELRHRFAGILLMTALGEQAGNVVEAQHVQAVPIPRAASTS